MIGKLLKDSFSSAMVPLVKLGITFIMAPVIVHALGNYDYGLWEIVFALIAYMEFLDIGLMPAIVRNVARYRALKDPAELQRIYSSSLTFFVPAGLLMSGGFLAFSFIAPETLLEAANSDDQKYSLFFLIMSAQVFLVFVGSVFDCYLEGLQLYSLRNLTTLAFSVIGAIIVYPLLKNGYGLLTLATANTCGFSLKFLLYGVLLSTRRFGRFRFKTKNVSRQTLKGLFSFGIKSFIWALSLRIATLSDPLVIGAFLGVALVPFYMIPSNFVAQARGLIWSVTRIFLPVFSTLDALGEKEKYRALYFGASRVMLGIIVPLVGGICILGPSFLALWMGHEYAEKGAYVLYILSIAHLVQWLNPFSRRFFTALDKHEILAVVGMIGGLVNLGLSLILVRFAGNEGVALGTLLPLLVCEPYLLYRTCLELGCSVAKYATSVIFPLILPAIVLVISLIFGMKLIPVNSIFDVVSIAILSMAIYIPFFVAFAMKRDERLHLFVNIRDKIFPLINVC